MRERMQAQMSEPREWTDEVFMERVAASLDELVSRLDELHANGAHSGAVVLTSSAEVQDLVTVLERARTSRLASITVMR